MRLHAPACSWNNGPDATATLGSGATVAQLTLDQKVEGSNPSSPANNSCAGSWRGFGPRSCVTPLKEFASVSHRRIPRGCAERHPIHHRR